jgi:uncharacterized protein (TIGR02646 family)
VRRVEKRDEPRGFATWKAQENEDWRPTYGVLQNPEKRELHLALLREQGHTCCYCGREIELAESHIEHFRPRSLREDLQLNFQNLFASCQRETKAQTPLVCGHFKGEQFDESFISPLAEGVEERFRYTLEGEVLPRDKAAAVMTSVLGLNIPFLKSRRGAALLGVFDPSFLDTATRDDLARIARSFRTPEADGTRPSFFHVIARFAEDLA